MDNFVGAEFYRLYALADGNQRIRTMEKMLEFSRQCYLHCLRAWKADKAPSNKALKCSTIHTHTHPFNGSLPGLFEIPNTKQMRSI